MTGRLHPPFLSLGAGVQSTTLALMAAEGLVGPMPAAAIFADTGWEPRAVYEHLDRLEKALPFPVVRVSAGNIRDDIIARKNTTGHRFAAVPWYTDGGGIGRRQCTKEYKLAPIGRALRGLLGYEPRQRIPAGAAEVWVGISTDEAIRMKPARVQWQRNRWPLIEMGMSRRECAARLASRGWTAPKSSCIGCPFHSNAMWRDMRDNAPDEWADAVAVDASLRAGIKRKRLEYMHPQRVPLDQVDLRTAADFGQGDLFLNECEGMCGV